MNVETFEKAADLFNRIGFIERELSKMERGGFEMTIKKHDDGFIIIGGKLTVEDDNMYQLAAQFIESIKSIREHELKDLKLELELL